MGLFSKIIEKLYFMQKGNLALYDSLTGLYNYNWFERIGINKYNNSSCYVTLIDLNNFKMINDVHGHSFGNAMLCYVSMQLKNISKVDSTAEVMRYGGDEFVIFSTTDLGPVINRDKSRLISFGSYHKVASDTIISAISKADEEMYTNKEKFKVSEENKTAQEDIMKINKYILLKE